YGRAGRNAVEQRQQVVVVHADAANGAGHAHLRRVRCTVDVDVAAHGIDCAEAIEARLFAAQPQNARQDPVAPRLGAGQRRAVDLAGRAAAAENGVDGLAGADPGAYAMPAARRAVAAVVLAGAVDGGGHGIHVTLPVLQSQLLTRQVDVDV